MLNIVNYLDLISYLQKKGGDKEGVVREAEEVTPDHILLSSWNAGVSRASKAPNAVVAVKNILKRVFPVICEITGTSTFVIICGVLAASHTKLFYYLGMPFMPILKLAGVAAEERTCALCFHRIFCRLYP